MKWLYYLIQWTWGLPMNLVGLCVFIICKLRGNRIYRYRNAIAIEIRGSYGLELGMFFLCSKYGSEATARHEYGHSIQNLWWGFLMPLVISIPSAIRFWYRRIYTKYIFPKQRKPLPSYNSIWFEGQATKLGKQASQNYWNWL